MFFYRSVYGQESLGSDLVTGKGRNSCHGPGTSAAFKFLSRMLHPVLTPSGQTIHINCEAQEIEKPWESCIWEVL